MSHRYCIKADIIDNIDNFSNHLAIKCHIIFDAEDVTAIHLVMKIL